MPGVFVRCAGGISHNPDEFITESDTAAGAEVLLRVIENFQLEDGSCLMDKTCVS